MTTIIRQFITFSLFLLIISFVQGQEKSTTLNLEEIMKGYDFIGHSPERPFWSLNGDTLYYYQKENNLSRSKLKAYVKATGEHIVLEASQTSKIKDIPFHSKVKTNQPEVFRSGDVVMYWDPKTEDLRALYQNDNIYQPTMSADGQSVFFRRDLNWFRHHLQDQQIIRLNDMHKKDDPSNKPQQQDQYTEIREKELFDYLKVEHSVEVEDSLYKDEVQNSKRLQSIYLGDNKMVRPLGISKNGRYAFYSVEQKAEKSESTDVPQWVTKSARVASESARPKVGRYPLGQELLIVDLFSQTHFIQDFATLTGIFDKPHFLEEYNSDTTEYSPAYSKQRPIRFRRYISSENGLRHVLEMYSVDNKDRWILELSPSNKSFKLIDRQRDEAWIGGPSISGSESIGFIGDKDSLYYKSEKSGFAHLYLYDFKTRKTEPLTSGNYEIHNVTLSKDGERLYIKANREHPGIYHYYTLEVNNQRWTQLTFKTGSWDLVWDHDESQAVALYSTSNKPQELFLVDDDDFYYPITKSTTPNFDNYAWRQPEVVGFKASDGQEVKARLYLPEKEKSNKAAIIFVHGAGYLQNAHYFWSQYYREYMFHNLLVDEGYTVLDIDYRGSKGYGRDWRTGIYRHMGGLDLSDHIDGSQFLIDSIGIDSTRIGIYGGSYGGFITLMALFNHPGTFACGAALRSVTDWAHYNHGYTSNILNTPEVDPLAFERSSPINFAEGLSDPLLMLHGMVDSNVQLQDIVRLSQRLIELKKENWDIMYYPVENHSFRHHTSWYDEYRRIFNLFEENLSPMYKMSKSDVNPIGGNNE